MCHFQKVKATLNGLFKALPEEFSDCHASPESHDFSVNTILCTLEYKFSLSFYTGKPPSGGLSMSLYKGWKTSGGDSVLTKFTILVIITCKWMLSNCWQRTSLLCKGSFGHFKQWQWLLCGTLHPWQVQRPPGTLFTLILSIMHLLMHSVIMLPLGVILQSLFN